MGKYLSGYGRRTGRFFEVPKGLVNGAGLPYTVKELRSGGYRLVTALLQNCDGAGIIVMIRL